MRIKEIIVVEGKDDTTAVKRAVEADTIETNGSAVNKSTIQQIKHAKEKRGVIVFTDPDYPGQRIRAIIDREVPGCKHAFLPKKEALQKQGNGVGIEHASPEAIQNALKSVYELTSNQKIYITKEDLLQFGLLGTREAKERRKKLGERLNIGFTNGKQLEKRLNMFQIERDEFTSVMEQILREEEKND
ncbi:ribonuclease M5 [Salirhabdus salicampi]|uniref:ribonuclease M5 n=1 Tax=Salirhabdus salicampi TaxID=476102 RepID=UPI0020C44F45|nr:ribonuclease M5 [Salirhabdus salicampi]MCP8618163.1 ribonuclease M5 [Salirhabdus salicampi]